MPEKTTLSLSSPMEDEEMEQSSTDKKINNLTKVRIFRNSHRNLKKKMANNMIVIFKYYHCLKKQ